MTTPGGVPPSPPDSGAADLEDLGDWFGGGLISVLFGGFANVLEAIFGTADNSYVANLAIITNHTAQLSEMRDSIEQMTARGRAVVFETSGWYQPPEGLVTLRLGGMGAGAGGAAGAWNLVPANQRGGGGGGGGGYSEIEITAALLPKTGGVFDPIRVDIFLAGNGGTGSGGAGGGGGNVIFGANLATPYATFQGGTGGLVSTLSSGGGGTGGFGMIPGGVGGGGARDDGDTVGHLGQPGGNSYATERYIAGGGGGGGGGRNSQPGGFGGNSVGAAGGTSSGQAGVSPHPAMAIGGGGGAGGTTSTPGGAGGYPSGGGGGGYAQLTAGSVTAGGKGGEAKLYVYEEMN